MTPQHEAIGAIYRFLHWEGYECWAFQPYGETGSFTVVKGHAADRLYFEVSLQGVDLMLLRYKSGAVSEGRDEYWRFDLCDPKCFDKLLRALEGFDERFPSPDSTG